ncbi:MAG: transcription-repair coupling factor [Bacilli bacterium]
MEKKLIDIIKSISFDTSSNSFLTDELIGIGVLTSKMFLSKNENIMVITQNLYSAEALRNFVSSLIGEENIIYLPAEEMLMVEYLASSSDIVSDRVFALHSALGAEHKVLICNIAAAARFYPTTDIFKEFCFHITKGSSLNLKETREKLLKSGYKLVNKVEKSCEFAIRGDILDIFSLTNDYPCRIDLFDEEVEKITYFEISTQESFKEVDEVDIIPSKDFIITEEDISQNSQSIIEEAKKEATEVNPEILSNTDADLMLLSNWSSEPRLYKYFSSLSINQNTIFDYFHCRTCIFSNYDATIIGYNLLLSDSVDFLNKLNQQAKNINSLSLFYEDIFNKINCRIIKNNEISIENPTSINVKLPTYYSKNLLDSKLNLDSYVLNKYIIHICFISEQQMDFYKKNVLDAFYKELDVEYLLNHKIFLEINMLSNGIEFSDAGVVYLTPKEIFGYKNNFSKYSTKFKQGTVLKSYDELKVGDYIVHENYGIGKYDGLKQITNNNLTNDYIRIIYKDDDVLYVPLEQFKLIRKYISREGYTPSLSKLFNGKWEKTKEKIKKRVSDLADKLVALYQERASKPGISFVKDDIYQEQFENDFDYQLTPDQETALSDIKKDMESPLSMDRLICGDVGFGKTELAFRAAFKAINSGKQVLLLCPTTLLAKQHYERAIERFSRYDIRVVCMTRFLSVKEFNNAAKDIGTSAIHFVIGTHKALSKKINYKDLGLLIIDEEQRFGVEHKEKIKMMFPNIDVLTLSATPIPRTLQMSLVGMKQMSLINTAPKNRTSIQTYLVKYDKDMIYELLSRELVRHGQAYYVINNIETLFKRADEIAKHLPGAKIAAVHGQMDKNEIDEIMNEFYLGNVDVLVTTTIIENGIDIANANLVLVEDANRFGLAQLYQIKGRVGRSNRLAYAYLMYKPDKKMDDSAKKRLNTIQEFTELGSGYKIAQRDLMIRGAGDILGAEQAGFINEVGIDLYLKLLNEAINEKQNGVDKKKDIEYQKMLINGFIPDKYAIDNNKFEIYQLINDSDTLDDLEKTIKKIIDIYGNIPTETNNLLLNRRIKICLKRDIFEKYIETKDDIQLYLSNLYNKVDGIGFTLFSSLFKYSKKTKITTSNGLIKIALRKDNRWLEDFNDIINICSKVYEGSKKCE